ncbi:2,3-bisphosphoglycerate-independent phosphoglycerate mutase [Litorilinea aerophila]|uniref:2,3-bisphosphoglycerate-independent phosphoglycerate mutase n=1 Tax=Litorilinea aerophila TaxID=1204385 RepID=A0A540VD30_9CHLR|nr:2,3-bisphosphoglycerate-independent phosphoglycerate mutase [Litorilinea aerophila]MCC9077550.1 2,3-bisphosphoglycerate-independent phosphoglycerate mutase [Litorilinea aerophila]OUC09300.1 phosphoglycerate mutase [Litorilinea aerophila]
MIVFTEHDMMKDLQQPGGKIVLLVMDGLGGLPMEPGGPTELEAANTPNLDRLAAEGSTGLSVPIRPGIEPGSGPAHLSLFSYDPVRYEIGRGVLEALGIGFPLTPNDLAARGNFATADADGVIVDRRAGRISTEECIRLCEKLQAATGDALPGYEVFVKPVKEHRFVLVIRGEGLGGQLTETDPLETGKKPLPVTDESGTPEGKRTAELVNQWVEKARAALADEPRANSLNLRGLAKDPGLPRFPNIYGMRAAAIAVYPMYRGVASLVGMEVIEFEGDRPEHEVDALARIWNDYDFFFIHVKKTDSYGEDGNFQAKVHEIEAVDAVIPRILELEPGALIVTGDHSTPARLRSHSWHPVPTLLWSPTAMPDQVQRFGERACASGHLGVFHATTLLPQAMAHAGRLKRFGA